MRRVFARRRPRAPGKLSGLFGGRELRQLKAQPPFAELGDVDAAQAADAALRRRKPSKRKKRRRLPQSRRKTTRPSHERRRRPWPTLATDARRRRRRHAAAEAEEEVPDQHDDRERRQGRPEGLDAKGGARPVIWQSREACINR